MKSSFVLFVIASSFLLVGCSTYDTYIIKGNYSSFFLNETSSILASNLGNGSYLWQFFYSNGTNYANFTTGNLTGAQGIQGVQGVPGTNGSIGLNGTDGESTFVLTSNLGNGSYLWRYFYTNGTNYANFTTGNLTGATGATGATGSTGAQGIPGVNGTNGVNGTDGVNGTSVVFNSITNLGNGSYAWNFSDGTYYITGNLTGATGAQGIQGVPGINGTNGTDGSNASVTSGDTYINVNSGVITANLTTFDIRYVLNSIYNAFTGNIYINVTALQTQATGFYTNITSLQARPLGNVTSSYGQNRTSTTFVNNTNYNIWTDLSATDPGDWVGSVNIFGIYAFNFTSIYTTISAGKFGVYNPVTNVWTDLSATDPGNWVGTTTLRSVFAFNETAVYIGGSSGKFGVYNPVTNVTSDLSATDPGNWVGTTPVRSVYAYNETAIYTVMNAGKFGVYDSLIGSDVQSTLSGRISFFTNSTDIREGIATDTGSAIDINGSLIVRNGGMTNQAVCWKSDYSLGYCTDAVNSTGGCTCT